VDNRGSGVGLNHGDTFTIDGVFVKENPWQWIIRKIRRQPRRLEMFTTMSWDARKDLLDRGFTAVENKVYEHFERGDIAAFLAYDVSSPYVVIIRLDRRMGDQVHSVDVLYPHWLDPALQLLDDKAYLERLHLNTSETLES
jgi:hypothetical protein